MHTMVVDVSPSRMVLTKLLGRINRRAHFSPIAPLQLIHLPDPPLPASDWVRVRNHLCGICGSDLHQLYLDAGLDVAPLALPTHRRIYLGHEMVGEVIEVGSAVTALQLGDRVVRWGRADDCRARGREELCDPCRHGHRVLCQWASEPREHYPVGGGFGDSFITPVATLVRVPDALADEAAIFTEPVAVAIHAAWRRPPAPADQVLVVGCGTIGLLLIQVLGILEPSCQITALAEFPWQADLALQMGARRTLLARDEGYARVAELTGAHLYHGRRGNDMLMGGYDLIFDVVGIPSTLNQALRWTRAHGTVVLVGVNLHRMRLDLTPVWYQEVDRIGAVGHDVVTWQGAEVSTFQLAMDWMEKGRLQVAPLLTHRFPLQAYRQAFAVAADKRSHRSIKVAFDLAGTGASL